MAGIIAAMPSLHADDALLPTGWARDVLLEWNEAGVLTRVEASHERGSRPRATGPVLPGMPNVHSHSFQRAMAGLAEVRGHPTDDFWTWREEMYRLVRLLDPEDVEAISAHLYVEMLKHGYTTVAEFHYLHNDREGRPYEDRAELANCIVTGASAAGIALTLLPVMYAHGGFGHKALAPAQRRFRSDPAGIVALLRDLESWHLPSPLLRLGVAPHSARAVDALLLTELVELASEIDPAMPIHMHVSEQQGEVAECIATHGTTPLAWIADLVPLDRRWTLIHSTHLTALEMRAAAKAGACLGLCPVTEANLGDGIFDFVPWFELRGAWGIGGDSHVSVSPFEELRALEYSQRLRLRIRNVASAEDRPDVAANLWSAAAEGGAQAVAQPVGALAPGRRADLVVLDREEPDFEALGAAACLSVAMFSGNSNRVRDVFVGGRLVIEQGRHPDEEDARSSFRDALSRLRRAP
ncbi:MAG TPA: formimidoylglutamate deiminase [Usitatibacter sp.]|nr:formimidoylglutamate deiminase [Usitatibacter sp.]